MIDRDSSQAFRMTSRDFCDCGTPGAGRFDPLCFRAAADWNLLLKLGRPLFFRREQFRFSFYRALTSAYPHRASRHRVCHHHHLVDRCRVRAVALVGAPRSR